jgi:hypothetical protein
MKRYCVMLSCACSFNFSISQAGFSTAGCINKSKPEYRLPFLSGQSYYHFMVWNKYDEIR